MCGIAVSAVSFADPTTKKARLSSQLLTTADVVILDIQPGSEEIWPCRLRVRKRNPRLVYCHLPAFGSKGPHARRYPDDTLVAAVSGLLEASGLIGMAVSISLFLLPAMGRPLSPAPPLPQHCMNAEQSEKGKISKFHGSQGRLPCRPARFCFIPT